MPHFASRTSFLSTQSLGLCLGLCLSLSDPLLHADDDAEEFSPPSHGVVARYESLPVAGDAARSLPIVVERLEAVPRLFGREGETPDHRLPGPGFMARWSGQLLVRYEGTYEFTVLRSSLENLTLMLDGRPILLGEGVELESGPVTISVSGMHRLGEPAFQLWWRSNLFADEPIAARFFALPDDATAGRLAAAIERQRLADRGAVLAETLGCARCHRSPIEPAEGLALATLLPGPRLDGAGSRLHRQWLVDWLKNPRGQRGDARMPALFDDTPADDLAAQTIASYLASGAVSPDAQPGIGGDAARGETLYRSAACAACHEPPKGPLDNTEIVSTAPALVRLAEKWQPGGLASFLRKPLETRPHGRMPDFGFTASQAADVAAYLLTGTASEPTPAAADKTPIPVVPITDEQLSAQWRDLQAPGALPGNTPVARLEAVALRQMTARGCFACHAMQGGRRFQVERGRSGPPEVLFAGERLTTAAHAPVISGREQEQLQAGCLDRRGGAGSAPRFSLGEDERQTLMAHVQSLPRQSTPSTMERTRIDLAILNCARCHDNEQQGGESLTALLKQDALLPGDEATSYFTPPTLTHVGERVRPERLSRWVTQGARGDALRPWLGARMPGFGIRGSRLAAGLTARDGALGPAGRSGPTTPEIKAPQVDPKRLKLGQYLVGARALACVTCHSLHGKMAGAQRAEEHVDPTTRSPDLAQVADHLRPEYFYRWMMNPARIRPHTKMPRAIQPDGKVGLRQMEWHPPGTAMTALWTYLSEGRAAPPPIDEPTIKITPTAEQPVMQRGEVALHKDLQFPRSMAVNKESKFPRAVAAGFAGGTVLFDADQLAVVATWPDGFIKSKAQHYFGLWWSREGGDADLLPTEPHPLSFQLTAGGPWQPFSLPLASDPNQGTRFEGVQVGKSAVRLRYRLLVGGHKVLVAEDVRWESRPAWQGFVRRFRFQGLPQGAQVAVALPVGDEVRQFSPRGEPVPDNQTPADTNLVPLWTCRQGNKIRAVRVPAGSAARWLAANNNGPPRVLSAPAQANRPLDLRVDLWSYLGKFSAPAAAELARLVSTPPVLVDNFDRDVQPASPAVAADELPPAAPRTLVTGVSPGYAMESIRLPRAHYKLSDVAFGDGMMYVSVLTEGEVWRTPIPPPDQPQRVRWQKYASGLYNPIGMQMVDGRLFVAQKPEITELVDRDGDGVVDHFRTVASGWGLSTGWHEYTFGLAVDRQKNLWFSLNAGNFWTNPGYVNPGRWRGSVMRYSCETDRINEVATGCRVPNGIVCGPGGDIFFTDNQGDWIESCKLAHVVPGRFYGHPEDQQDVLPEGEYPDGRSAVWLPYNLERTVRSASTSGPVWDGTQGAFGPFADQMFVGDAGYGANPGIMRIALQKVDGEYQGAALRFVDNRPLGCLRMKFGPHNQLYMCSLTTGLTRMKYQGPTPLAIHSLEILPGGRGFVIRLTRPLAKETRLQPADFRVRKYHYVYSGEYGSPEADSAHVPVEEAVLASDRLSIRLTFPVENYLTGMVYEINVGRLVGENGEPLQHNDAWYTVHRIPK